MQNMSKNRMIIVKKLMAILLVGTVVFCVGGVVAYYNTSAFGYDNANLITFKENAVQVLDFEISYQQMRQAAESVEEFLPKRLITI